MKTLLGVILAITATAAMAAQEPENQYRGQDLDIAKVVSVTPTSTACDVVPATMVYIDHQGETHRVAYQVMGTCSGA